VTPVRFELAFFADKQTLPSPQVVKFHSGSVPYAYKNYAIPFKVTKLEWRTENGLAGQTIPCQPSVNPCYTEVKESGTMTVTALVNGFELTKSVSVQVVPCPTADSLLDNLVLRAGLGAAWTQSNADAQIDSRIERGLYLFDSTSVYVFRLSPRDTVDTPCINANIPTAPFPGRPVVGAHVHPFSLTDSLPAKCRPPGILPGEYTIYGNPFGGPSRGDWGRSWNEQLPLVVVDKDSLYRIYPHPMDSTLISGKWKKHPSAGWESKYFAAPRVSGSCVRV
jgi:hypothetical protein